MDQFGRRPHLTIGTSTTGGNHGRGRVEDGSERQERGGVISQEALEAAEGDGGQEAEVSVGRSAAAGGGGDGGGVCGGAGGDEAMQISQDLLDGPVARVVGGEGRCWWVGYGGEYKVRGLERQPSDGAK